MFGCRLGNILFTDDQPSKYSKNIVATWPNPRVIDNNITACYLYIEKFIHAPTVPLYLGNHKIDGQHSIPCYYIMVWAICGQQLLAELSRILEHINGYFPISLYFNFSFCYYHGLRGLMIYNLCDAFFHNFIALRHCYLCFLSISTVYECGTIMHHDDETHKIFKEARGLVTHKAIKV